jgi:hypothetical protein
MASASTPSSARIGALCAILTDRLPRVPYASKKLFQHMKAEDFKPTQIEDWFARAQDELKILHQAVVKCESYGIQVGTKPVHDMSNPRIPKREPRDELRSKHHHKDKEPHHREKERPEKRKSSQDSHSCRICGRNNHSPESCQLNVHGHRHPDGNQTDQEWAESPMGKAWEAKGHRTLPFNETLSGAAWQPPSKSTNDKKSFGERHKKCEEKLNSLILHSDANDKVGFKSKNNSCHTR